MHRLARTAIAASSLLFVASLAGAQPKGAPSASTTASPAATTPLGSALDALRTSDYPRAERELAAIRGADQPAAQVALARVMLETGRFAEADRIAQQASANAAQKLAAIALR